MSKEKSMTIMISEDCLKKIKKLAIDNDLSTTKQVSALLEKFFSNKKEKPIELNQDN